MAKSQRRLAIVNARVVPLYGDLAAEIGVNESLLLVQLDFLIGLAEKDPPRHLRDERFWTYQSVTDLQEYFPFMGRATIQRAIESLLRLGLISVTDRYNQRKGDKTRWFAINYDACERLGSLSVKDRSDSEQAVPDRNKPFQNGTTPFQNGTTLPETTPETTQKDSPLPPSGGNVVAFPSTKGEPVTPDVAEMATVENDPTPPTPSPRAVAAGPATSVSSLDRGSSLRAKRAMKTNGWSEYPEKFAKLTHAVRESWKKINPSRIDEKQLALMTTYVAPDEANDFAKRTNAYLKSIDDPQFCKSLRKWLEVWRTEPIRQRPMNQAEINQAWMMNLPNGADLARAARLAEAQ